MQTTELPTPENADQARILDRVTLDEDRGCWTFGPVRKDHNYGVLSFKGRVWTAHRLSYTLFVGPVPAGLVVDHVAERCGNKACCNPAHLEPVTVAENTQRGNDARRGDRCKAGLHEYTPENTYTKPNGDRSCRTCSSDRGRERRAEKKAGTFKPKPATDAERFFQYVTLGPTGCWKWQGALVNGYGHFAFRGRPWQAHRASYVLFVGPIPDGYQVDHTCQNTRCVSPLCLEAVPHHVNNARSTSPSAVNARKTECDKGHPLSGDNLYAKPNGWRGCRTCRTEHNRASRARRDADLARRESYLVEQRVSRAERKATRDADPEQRAAYLAKKRVSEAAKRAARDADPVRRTAYLAKARAYQAGKDARKKAERLAAAEVQS